MGEAGKAADATVALCEPGDDETVRTRGNELFRCIRLEGVNSSTTDDDYLDRTDRLLASMITQIGLEFAFYVHKVSNAIDPDLAPIAGDDFAAAVDRRWTDGLLRIDLRDKTLLLMVMHRPPSRVEGAVLG